MYRNTLLACLAALLIAVPQAQAQDQSQGQQTSGNVQFVGSLKSGQWISTDIVGQEVMNSSGDSVGDVNALVLGQDNQVSAAVLGVGGFLGIGGKNVALNFDAISRKQNQDGSTILTANVTKEQLDAAPEFKGRESGTMKQVEEQARETAGDVAKEGEKMGSEAAQKAEEAANKAQEAAEMARKEAAEATGEQSTQQQ